MSTSSPWGCAVSFYSGLKDFNMIPAQKPLSMISNYVWRRRKDIDLDEELDEDELDLDDEDLDEELDDESDEDKSEDEDEESKDEDGDDSKRAKTMKKFLRGALCAAFRNET